MAGFFTSCEQGHDQEGRHHHHQDGEEVSPRRCIEPTGSDAAVTVRRPLGFSLLCGDLKVELSSAVFPRESEDAREQRAGSGVVPVFDFRFHL